MLSPRQRREAVLPGPGRLGVADANPIGPRDQTGSAGWPKSPASSDSGPLCPLQGGGQVLCPRLDRLRERLLPAPSSQMSHRRNLFALRVAIIRSLLLKVRPSPTSKAADVELRDHTSQS